MTPEAITETLRLHLLWLSGAGGVRADLRGADLSEANLRWANLRWADLSGADLRGTVLAPSLSPWAWTQAHGLNTRTVDGRALGLYRRTRASNHITPATTYEPGTLYIAPVFSRCQVTECHPGLYVAGKDYISDDVLVLAAGWVDELLPCGPDKARLPRLRIVADQHAWEAITTTDMEPGTGVATGAPHTHSRAAGEKSQWVGSE